MKAIREFIMTIINLSNQLGCSMVVVIALLLMAVGGFAMFIIGLF